MTNNGDNKLPVDCPYCVQRFSVTVPRTYMFNNPYVSVATAPHEKPIMCINCGHYMVIGFASLQIGWAIAPISDEKALEMQPSRIVLPDGPLPRIG